MTGQTPSPSASPMPPSPPTPLSAAERGDCPATGAVDLPATCRRQTPQHTDRTIAPRRRPLSEMRRRSILKAVIWRVLASLTTMGLVFMFTHETKTAFWVGVFEVAAKMTLYYGHERMWNHIGWGRLELGLADSGANACCAPE